MHSVFALLASIGIASATIDDWKLVLTLDGDGTAEYDVGEANFNHLFQNSHEFIIKRECLTCSADYQTIYYKRYTDPQNFNAYNHMKDWSNRNNVLGVNFNLYSTLADVLLDDKQNAWKYCNYNDPGIGAFRDCGKTGYVPWQWTSQSRGGHKASFYVYSHDMSRTLRYFGTTTGFTSWSDAQKWCSDNGASLATFQTAADVKEIIDTCMTGSYCYTGWDDVDLDGNYEFVNGKPFDSLGLWAPGQPSNNAGWHCGLVKYNDPYVYIYDGVCSGWNGSPMSPVCEHNTWSKGEKVCTAVVSGKKWKKMCPSFTAERSCTAPRPKYSTVDKCDWVDKSSIGYCSWQQNTAKKPVRLCGKAKTKSECESKQFPSKSGSDNCVWSIGNPPPAFIDEMEEYLDNMEYYDDLDAANYDADNALDAVAFRHRAKDAKELFGDLEFNALDNELQSGYQYNIGAILMVLVVMIAGIYCYKLRASKNETVDFDELDGV